MLVLDNAMLYNKPGTPYYKTAMRIKGASEPLLGELDMLATSAPLEIGQAQAQPPVALPQPPLPPPAETIEASTSNPEEGQQPEVSEQEPHQPEDEPQLHPQPQPQPSTSDSSLATSHSTTSITTASTSATNRIGNLEPPLSFLSLLLSESVFPDLQPISDYILTSAPLSYILQFDLGEPVPPPPAPPTPPPPPTPLPTRPTSSRAQSVVASKRAKSKEVPTDGGSEKEGGKEVPKEKPKRDYKAENARRKERERQRALDASAGFRAPGLRTRRAAAVEAAFEKEAAGDGMEQSQEPVTRDGTAEQEVGDAFSEKDEQTVSVSVEPEVEVGADAGPSRTAPTSEAQVEAQVEIDVEGDAEGDIDVDVEMVDAEPQTEQPEPPLHEAEPESSTQPSIEPSAHQPSASVEVEDGATATAGPSKQQTSSTKRRKRPSYTPNQVPAIVEDVGKKDAFLNFDSGWILPEGHRRGGRKAPVIQWPSSVRSGEPAAKRAKHGELLLPTLLINSPGELTNSWTG